MSKETEDEKEWIVKCGVCSAKTEVTWKQACNDGCPVCCSFKVEVYHRTSLEKEESKREV